MGGMIWCRLSIFLGLTENPKDLAGESFYVSMLKSCSPGFKETAQDLGETVALRLSERFVSDVLCGHLCLQWHVDKLHLLVLQKCQLLLTWARSYGQRQGCLILLGVECWLNRCSSHVASCQISGWKEVEVLHKTPSSVATVWCYSHVDSGFARVDREAKVKRKLARFSSLPLVFLPTATN